MIDEQVDLHKELEEDHVEAFMNKWMNKDSKAVGETFLKREQAKERSAKARQIMDGSIFFDTSFNSDFSTDYYYDEF